MTLYKINPSGLREKDLNSDLYCTLECHYRSKFGKRKDWNHDIKFVVPSLCKRYKEFMSPEKMSEQILLAQACMYASLVVIEHPVFVDPIWHDVPLPSFMRSLNGLLLALAHSGLWYRETQKYVHVYNIRINKNDLGGWSEMLWNRLFNENFEISCANVRGQREVVHALYPIGEERNKIIEILKEKGAWK